MPQHSQAQQVPLTCSNGVPVICFPSLIDPDAEDICFSLSEAGGYSTCDANNDSGCCVMCNAPTSLSIDCAQNGFTFNHPFGGFVICFDESTPITSGPSCQTFVFPSGLLPTMTINNMSLANFFAAPGFYSIDGFAADDTNANGVFDAEDSVLPSVGPMCFQIMPNTSSAIDVSISPQTSHCVGVPIVFDFNNINIFSNATWSIDNEPQISCTSITGGISPIPMSDCQQFIFTPTEAGTYTISLMANLGTTFGCAPEQTWQTTIVVGEGACCIAPSSVACCMQQNANSYLWFDAAGNPLPLGTTTGETQNFATAATATWSPNNHPFTGFAGTVTDPIRINGDINLLSNANITMQNLFFEFGPNGRIQLLCLTNCASLIVDNCVLDGDPTCQTMWQGIRVQGPGQNTARAINGSTHNYAIAEVKNNTQINNAIIGVAGSLMPLIDLDDLSAWTYYVLNPVNFIPTVSGAFLWEPSSSMPHTFGGVCISYRATFNNCLQGMHLRGYNNINTANPSQVTNLMDTFFNSEGGLWYPFNQNAAVPTTEAGIELIAYKNLTIVKTDNISTVPNFNNLKYGIRGIVSSQITLKGSIFNNNRVGISSLGVLIDPLINNFGVGGCIFTNCRNAIQASGSNMRINACSINPIAAGSVVSNVLTDIGILLRACDFTVRKNQINQCLIGTAIMANGNTSNDITLNRFTFDGIGVWGFGNNGNPTEGGTQITCNNFDNFIVNALLTQDYTPPAASVLPAEGGSLANQGFCDNTNLLLQNPADNTFKSFLANSPHIFSTTPTFTYFARPDAAGSTYVPQNVTPNVTVELCGPSETQTVNCGGTAPKPPGSIKIIANEWERNREAAKKLYAYWEEGADSATIVQLFDELYTEQSYRKMLPYYIAQDDDVKYNIAMNSLSDSNIDNYYFKQLQTIYRQLRQSGRSYMQLSPSEETIVRQIANSNTRAAFDAHALLYIVRGEEFEVPLPLLPNEIAALVGTNNMGSIAFKTANNTSNLLNIVPNPAANSAEISYNIGNDKTATWQLYNISGQLVIEKTLQNNGTLYLDLSAIPQGVYYYTLSNNENVLQSDKLVIIK